MKVNVKLGRGKSRGFYPKNIEKEFTEILEGKMPFNVLSVLNESELFRELGVHELTISEKLLELQPDLAVDQYGYSSSLPLLLKDFIAGGLVAAEKPKYKITKLGREFLKYNTIKEK